MNMFRKLFIAGLFVIFLLLVFYITTLPNNSPKKAEDKPSSAVNSVDDKKPSQDILKTTHQKTLPEIASPEKSLTVDTSSQDTSQDPYYTVDFGEESITETINSGWVFFDGLYLAPPYKIKRKGLGFFINDVMVMKSGYKWPPEDMSVSEDPGFPEGLTPNSTFEDLKDKNKRGNSHNSRKWRYLHQHYPLKIAREKMVEYYKSLPFIMSVEWNKGILVVETLKGEKRNIWLTVTEKPPDKEEISHNIKFKRFQIEENLKKDGCYFFLSRYMGNEVVFDCNTVYSMLPEMIDIMKSDKLTEDKVHGLKEITGRFTSWSGPRNPWEELVALFHSTPQLEERIERLRIDRTDSSKQLFDAQEFKQFLSDKIKELGRDFTEEEEKNIMDEYFKYKAEKARQREEQRKQKDNENK